ncbi:MAG: FAD-dependent 5-carboxymethylaminomethyl-2-thiouridine(34) oxidoreductase MnmC, partial [Bdellovibrionales bacterium]|nr:FAD-dependent 5-carboxymethylaminomethyl-2-thiouridine(34) oxidoreductase MnmC [Massilia sp.]
MDWQGRARFTVFDSAFGAGERFRALVKAWRDDPLRPARLHYIALDASPLPGCRRLPQADEAVTLDLLCAPLEAALAQLDARFDAIELHGAQGAHGVQAGFARDLARRCAPGAVLVAHGLSELQARELAGAGFACHATDQGTLKAVFTSRKPPSPWARAAVARRRAIVLGAGLAGAAACERLCARGWEVTLIERHAAPAQEASGNQAGIFMPLLSRDDNIMTRLARASFLYALAYWKKLGGFGDGGIVGAQCGVLQLARDERHAQVQQAIAAEHGYPPDYAQWFEPGQACAFMGLHAPHGAWLFAQAGWARPASVCAVMLDACGPALARHFGAGQVSLERGADEWIARAAPGVALASAPVVIVATGAGAIELAQSAQLPLAKVRGQVTHLAQGSLPA